MISDLVATLRHSKTSLSVFNITNAASVSALDKLGVVSFLHPSLPLAEAVIALWCRIVSSSIQHFSGCRADFVVDIAATTGAVSDHHHGPERRCSWSCVFLTS